ncbi:MAG: CRISPR-associated endonuclease Cas2 [Anaerolineales bacterium]|nr:CRISPR-associated endonuclease Cas2 [Anaerolineales bacterium]
MRIVISYDISNDKRRRRIARIMEGYGYRVQYSVFECDLDAGKLAELQKRLTPLVNTREWESVRIYPLTLDCADRVIVIGKDLRKVLKGVEIV